MNKKGKGIKSRLLEEKVARSAEAKRNAHSALDEVSFSPTHISPLRGQLPLEAEQVTSWVQGVGLKRMGIVLINSQVQYKNQLTASVNKIMELILLKLRSYLFERQA